LCIAGATTAQNSKDTKPEVERLIQELGDSQFKTREAAEESLLKRGKKVLQRLKVAASKSDDPEIKWRASRLVRRIEDAALPSRGPVRTLRKRVGQDSRSTQGQKSEGGSASGDKDVPEMLEGLRRSMGTDAMNSESRAILERVMKQLQEGLGKQGQGLPQVKIFDFPGVDITKLDGRAIQRVTRSQGRSMQMSMGPDGVRVELEELDENGKKQRKVYQAETMDAFKKKYPGILDEDAPLPGGILRRNGLLDRLRPRGLGAPVPESDGRKLGFYTGEITPSVRDYLGLEDGVGLMVDRVVDGSLAQKLALQSRDILVAVQGVKIFGTADVARGLAKTKSDDEVSIRVLRRGLEVVLGMPRDTKGKDSGGPSGQGYASSLEFAPSKDAAPFVIAEIVKMESYPLQFGLRLESGKGLPVALDRLELDANSGRWVAKVRYQTAAEIKAGEPATAYLGLGFVKLGQYTLEIRLSAAPGQPHRKVQTFGFSAR
jgi:hypothetical protein